MDPELQNRLIRRYSMTGDKHTLSLLSKIAPEDEFEPWVLDQAVSSPYGADLFFVMDNWPPSVFTYAQLNKLREKILSFDVEAFQLARYWPLYAII